MVYIQYNMGYRSLRAAAKDLEKTQQLIRVPFEVDPYLEMAEIHRRIFDQSGPAILYEQVKGSPFEAISNVYGSKERVEFLFRNELSNLAKVVQLKIDASLLLKSPWRYRNAPFTALKALPWKTKSGAVVRKHETTIKQLPQVVGWPKDGGAFVTLPQVITEMPGATSIMQSNIGMYRIQLSGNDYKQDHEVGMHYQLHRGIGVHHQAYLQSDQPFKASIGVGGPPSYALSAIFPLPEGLSEMTFAGMLAGHRYQYHKYNGSVIPNQCDFCITGTILKGVTKEEGPFGDHLGYYSLSHDFPVMQVDKVFHRPNPLWHFTVVGRPPQEDSLFGYLIHKIIGDLVPAEFPGVKEVNAVDEAGVHPLLLAIGSERYMPFRDQKPEEILTQANHLLGSGQTSLAKYLWITGGNEHPELSTHDYPEFFGHMLSRLDFSRDLHFQTKTTIDTLDYSGSDWNAGSKVVFAAYGPELRSLAKEVPSGIKDNSLIKNCRLQSPGIIVLEIGDYRDPDHAKSEIDELKTSLQNRIGNAIPLVVVVDDASFAAQNWPNFLWVTFTRSNPSHDIYGMNEQMMHKHWCCDPPLIIDARIKPHHAPTLEVPSEVSKRVDELMFKDPELKKYLG